MGVVLVDENGAPVSADPFYIYPCNQTASDLFERCQTQWQRHPATGELAGLHYQGVESAASMAGIDMTPELFDDIRQIEAGALGAPASFEALDALNIIHVGFSDDG